MLLFYKRRTLETFTMIKCVFLIQILQKYNCFIDLFRTMKHNNIFKIPRGYGCVEQFFSNTDTINCNTVLKITD